MNRIELERLFGELLSERDVSEQPATMEKAALVSAWTHSRAAKEDPNSGPETAVLSAYLDGASGVLDSPGEICDLDAASSFLDRVKASASPVPPDLITEMTKPVRVVCQPVGHLWLRHASGRAAAAAVASALVLFAVARIGENPTQGAGSVANTVGLLDTSNATSPTGESDLLIDGKSFNVVVPAPPAPAPSTLASNESAPVYTAPNPPVAITSHAVTVADYPAVSVRLLEQGAVRINYLIRTDGTVGDCQVTQSSGFPRLDAAACAIVMTRWQFKPATLLDGSPVPIWMPADIVFQLANPVPSPADKPPSPTEPGANNSSLAPPPTSPVATTSHAVTAEDYPPMSIRLGEEGSVAVKYVVGTDGNVTECAVTTPSGKPRLDDAACAMVERRWKFKPATQNGKPVTAGQTATIIFALR